MQNIVLKSTPPNSPIRTLKDFVLRVAALDDVSDAYYVFEDECTKELRAQIYKLSNCKSEPFRTSMHIIGFTNY